MRWQIDYESPAVQEEKRKEAGKKMMAEARVRGDVTRLNDIPLYAREFIIEAHNAAKN